MQLSYYLFLHPALSEQLHTHEKQISETTKKPSQLTALVDLWQHLWIEYFVLTLWAARLIKIMAEESIVFPYNYYLSLPICQSQQTWALWVFMLSSAAINHFFYFHASCRNGFCKLELADEIEEASSYTFPSQGFALLPLVIKNKSNKPEVWILNWKRRSNRSIREAHSE